MTKQKDEIATSDYKPVAAGKRDVKARRNTITFDQVKEGKKPEHNMGPGWMLKADPKLKAAVDAKKAKYKEFKKLVGTKTNEEVIVEGDDHYAAAEKSKHNAELAKGQARPFDHHMHMADHHDHMSQWHDSKGRHGEAAKHAEKSDEHHEKAMSVKESVELAEATPYYNKPSFLKRMGAAAKQERLAREKKEKEAKPVKEEAKSALDKIRSLVGEAKYNHNDNRRGFGRREREDDEYHVPDPEIKKNKVKKEEVEHIEEARVNGREYASHGLMHPDHAKMDIHKVSGQHVDFYASKTGDKMQGKVVKNDGKEVHIQAHKDKEIGDGKLHKFKVKSSLPKSQNEGLDIKKSGMGDVIKDFSKSDAPQFKGKSAAKRRQMAIAAKLEADRMKTEEVEQIEELSKTTLGNYVKKAANDKADTAFHRGYSAYNNSDHKPYSEPMKNKVHKGQENRNKGIKRAVSRLTKEDIKLNSFKSYMQEDLDEAAWPGTPEYKKKFPETSRGKVGDKKVGAKGTQTVTSTGVKHERDYEKAEKETGSTETQEKRGRGRPAGSKSGARNK